MQMRYSIEILTKTPNLDLSLIEEILMSIKILVIVVIIGQGMANDGGFGFSIEVQLRLPRLQFCLQIEWIVSLNEGFNRIQSRPFGTCSSNHESKIRSKFRKQNITKSNDEDPIGYTWNTIASRFTSTE
ncbi:uncharacterized protein LOC131879446 [Tigriopus californicus]|uniref:uncharacterized protein LOC131879446 n=1 Tax=Tigriopus californicus TaxID=6832 RepID=UPI0027DA23ED|nr:uncharacterized protein LOC131879446 [Tigriopus californicus]